MKIYTKTGDGGTTGTLAGRVSKAGKIAAALGGLDEVNSWLGVVRQEVRGQEKGRWEKEVKRMQKNVMRVGSRLAGSGTTVPAGETKRLEKLIDELTGKLPKLGRFIYPVGKIQVARAVARRGERAVVEAKEAGGEVGKRELAYVNRLSDMLFTLARWINKQEGETEEEWVV